MGLLIASEFDVLNGSLTLEGVPDSKRVLGLK